MRFMWPVVCRISCVSCGFMRFMCLACGGRVWNFMDFMWFHVFHVVSCVCVSALNTYLDLRILFILSLDRSISAFIANKDRCLIFFACKSSSCIRVFSKSSLVASRAMVKIFAFVSAFMCTGGLLIRNSSYSSRCLLVPPIYSFKRYVLSPLCRAQSPAAFLAALWAFRKVMCSIFFSIWAICGEL